MGNDCISPKVSRAENDHLAGNILPAGGGLGTPAIVLNKTAQQLANKSYRDFWKTIKKLKGSERVTAKVIDDNYTDETIVNNFRNIYSTLYNSVDDRKINDTKLKIENLVENKCNKKLCNSNCHKVSSEQIKNAIKCLNNGKDDETYNIFSDNFLHAADLTHNILSQLVTAMLIMVQPAN